MIAAVIVPNPWSWRDVWTPTIECHGFSHCMGRLPSARRLPLKAIGVHAGPLRAIVKVAGVEDGVAGARGRHPDDVRVPALGAARGEGAPLPHGEDESQQYQDCK